MPDFNEVVEVSAYITHAAPIVALLLAIPLIV